MALSHIGPDHALRVWAFLRNNHVFCKKHTKKYYDNFMAPKLAASLTKSYANENWNNEMPFSKFLMRMNELCVGTAGETLEVTPASDDDDV
jgi:hypothetical protein